MRAEIFAMSLGSFTGGSNWKNAVFPQQLVVTATKDSDLSNLNAFVTLSGICATPGVNWEWDFRGSFYDVQQTTLAFLPGDYTVIVSKTGYQNGQDTITVLQLP